ncbi:predicted protein [Sclerotinia sclerotiorum 1980 UF-70]|uniref:Uncharacterized protein n=2 Tax=Sclerotinia sclerotiorum (strain ATCC 18683 / 1980 / Ss-1) TaxID=665079 RepID=A7F4S9_SCLS1|nr:predicted protein [Sclerotinia sclerotiorum 1980 UF-70]APA10587.1 hypothetical protein sscle_06g053570 [Sclerotinia sclerotiorum 1980 UF-70]EDN97750.1 predicted protein [Sclerotinia sclerotiorum 1980 UF-70]
MVEVEAGNIHDEYPQFNECVPEAVSGASGLPTSLSYLIYPKKVWHQNKTEEVARA